MNLGVASKSDWRARLRAALKAVLPADRAAASKQLQTRMQSRPEWLNARQLLLYAPLRDELDCWPLVGLALREGKIVGLPRFVKESGQYEVRRIENIEKDLLSGNYGIMEPSVNCAAIPPESLDLALVPGLGFTRDGYRLGRGHGYYDRLLAQVNGLKCGVGFDWQMGIQFPAEPHDVRLNCIVSPLHWLSFAEPGAV